MYLKSLILVTLLLTGCVHRTKEIRPTLPNVATVYGRIHLVVPVPIETLMANDMICFFYKSQWTASKIISVRGPGTLRVQGPGMILVSSSNYGGKLVSLTK